MGRDSDSALHDLARQTFADFLNVRVVSLLLLVPHTLTENVALFMMLFGILGIFRISRALLRMLRKFNSRGGGTQLAQRFLLSLAGNTGLLPAGALMLRPEFDVAVF